ncbi:MAG TPA: hypothetical protein VNW46_15125 [Gemmatimonadaceae bacterium]|nr:hypothetical protein [Gemmatimonadaceae bacterium]
MHEVRLTSSVCWPLGSGSAGGASLSSNGQRLAEARITLREPVPDPTTVFNARRHSSGISRAWSKAARTSHGSMSSLSLTDDLALVDLWTGETELTVPEARGEGLPRRGE